MTRLFLLPEDFALDRFLEQIGEQYGVVDAGTVQQEKLYLDTHDWRLFNEGHSITRKGISYTLWAATGEKLFTRQGPRSKYPFWWDFTEPPLQKVLKKSAGIRSLIPRIQVNTSITRYNLLNKDEKIVLRLSIEQHSCEVEGGRAELPAVLNLEPLKGYDKPYSRTAEWCLEAGLLEKPGFNLIGTVLHHFGIDPGHNDSRFTAQLDPRQTVAQAVRDICLILKGAMERNIPGTLEDIDSEFLHDLRVAMRRTRSLLSVMKGYLPGSGIDHFKNELKWLGTVTGPLRDLDVYLLNIDTYRAMLPAELHPGLECFFDTLRRQRKRQLKQLRDHLSSERVSALLTDWEQYLVSLPEREDYPAGQKNSKKVAEKIIRKRFKRILKRGAAITESTPDEQVHELRIEGKKFRYLLEFYRSLFAGEVIDAYLKQMKKLQNNLGDFNDYSVQKEMLVARLATMRTTQKQSLETAAALGGLIVHLGDRQLEVRQKFSQTFARFATPENVELMEKILAGEQTDRGGKK